MRQHPFEKLMKGGKVTHMTYRHDLHGTATHDLRTQRGGPPPGGRARRRPLIAPILKYLQKFKEDSSQPTTRKRFLTKLMPVLNKAKLGLFSEVKASTRPT